MIQLLDIILFETFSLSVSVNIELFGCINHQIHNFCAAGPVSHQKTSISIVIPGIQANTEFFGLIDHQIHNFWAAQEASMDKTSSSTATSKIKVNTKFFG
mgnify:CR=1 FL=1